MSKKDRYLNALQRRKAATAAKDDLLVFTRLMKPDPSNPDDVGVSLYQTAKHHRVIAAALEQLESGKIKRLIINCAPRHGKSELASRMFPAWFAGRHPDKSLILATYSDKLSWDFGREIRQIMEEPLYSQVFPDQALRTASVDRIEMEGGGKIFCVGRGAALTGRGATGLLIDDAIKDRVEADSLTTRKKLWDWYNQVAKTRLHSSKGWVCIIQTRWHVDDLVGRLTDPTNPDYSPVEGPKWKIIDLPALANEPNDPLGRKMGEALWPERFPVQYLEDIRSADPRGFQALYQGSPAPEKGNFFPADRIKTYGARERPPNDRLRFYAASDHAVSIRQDRDKTCLIVIGVDDDQNIWVMDDLVWAHLATDVVVERMIDLMAKYKPLFWWAEKGHISRSIGPFLHKRMLERSTFCRVFEMTPNNDKQTRAQSVMGRIAQGMVYFPAYAPWWVEARTEMLQFPFGIRDDFCLSGDTLVTMGDGSLKRLDMVRRGDSVMTRKGPRQVSASAMTSPDAKVLCVKISDGRTLVGTGAHPVWVEGKGFVRVDALAYNDVLYREGEPFWARAKLSFTAAVATIATQIASTGSIACISYLRGHAEALCTGICGRTATAQLQPATLSTTETVTRSTTTSIILNAYRLAITESCTRKHQTGSMPYVPLPKSGIAVTQGENGIENTVKVHGQIGKKPRSFVSAAAAALKRLFRVVPGFASKIAPYVISVEALTTRQPVFNISVTGENEFFANGILTHNCDALSWAGIGLNLYAGPRPPKVEQAPTKVGSLAWVKQQSIREREAKNAAVKMGW